MTLMHPIFDTPIKFCENSIETLVLENSSFFTKFIKDLLAQSDGEEGEIVLSKNFEPIKISKTVNIVTDFLTLDPNSKKVQTGLINLLLKHAVEDEMYLKTNEILCKTEQYLDLLLQDFDFNVEFAEFTDISAILKAANVKIAVDYCDTAELVCDYIDIVFKILKVDLFVFVNLKTFLTEEQLDVVFDFAVKNKYFILLAESTQRPLRNYEREKVIDKDLCQIT